MVTAEQLISKLNLKPLPQEGGYYIETYRSQELIPADALPADFTSSRSYLTAIYYLLTSDTFSAIHRIPNDEIFHFYLGDPVEMLQLYPDGSGKIITLGSEILNGQHPQVVVPGEVWQGARLVSGGSFALMGTTVAPGFDFADYEAGDKQMLVSGFSKHRQMIEALIR